MEIDAVQRPSYVPSRVENNYDYGPGSDFEYYNDKMYGENKNRARIANARKITHILVIICAVATFSSVFARGLTKLFTGRVLQREFTESETDPWFKFAICLRPYMTDSLVKDMYVTLVNETFDTFLSEKTKLNWNESFYLDFGLEPDRVYEYYQSIHPWDKLSLRSMAKHRSKLMKKTFKEFRIDRDRMTYTRAPAKGGSHQLEDITYTTLPQTKRPNVSAIDNALLGDYRLSPSYLGCVNVTVDQSMSKRQMEVVIKFRSSKTSRRSISDDTKASNRKVKMYDVVDIFAYNANDSFTEFPSIEKFSRFSIRSTFFAFLWVKGIKRIKMNTASKPCKDEPGYSSTKCHYWCVVRAFLENLNCTLPWMDDLFKRPWTYKEYTNIEECPDSTRLQQALYHFDEYFSASKSRRQSRVTACKIACTPSCTAHKVQMMSLGGKSLGKNYGISLTFSPDMQIITEYFDYGYLNMLAELCASVSFLFGLSSIAIYDWMVALAEWCVVKARGLQHSTEQPSQEGEAEPTSDTQGHAGAEPNHHAD